MISWMSVSQAKVEFARITDAGHQLLLLALGLVASVGEDLVLGPDLTVVLNVGGHHCVRYRSSGHRYTRKSGGGRDRSWAASCTSPPASLLTTCSS